MLASRNCTHSKLLAAAVAILLLPMLASAAPIMRLTWDGLSIVVGKTVSIAMPGTVVITGKAIGLESDALLVKVKKTSDPASYPKGNLRIPREKLHILQMETKGVKFRVAGTLFGAAAGFTLGGLAAFAESWYNNNNKAAAALFVGIGGGATVGGYFGGNSADKHWTTIDILP